MNPTSAPPHHPNPARRACLGIAAILIGICLSCAWRLWFASAAPNPASPAARLRLNPNHATRQELMLLPGLGPNLSQRIVAHRQQSRTAPAFETADDLANVRGIGPATVAKLRPHLRFDPQPPDEAGSPP